MPREERGRVATYREIFQTKALPSASATANSEPCWLKASAFAKKSATTSVARRAAMFQAYALPCWSAVMRSPSGRNATAARRERVGLFERGDERNGGR